jgi:transcriptional regulator with XRE-family HTH domain
MSAAGQTGDVLDELGIGRSIRAARVRLRMRQVDLASDGEVSRRVLSELENGKAGNLRLKELDRLAGVVKLRLVVDLRPARGDLSTLGDVAHASLVDAVARILQANGWETRFEPTGGSGSIDVLAFHPATRMLLVVEVKSRLVDLQRTLRDFGHRTSSARIAALEHGWKPLAVSRLLVVGATATQRRIVRNHAAIFGSAFPVRTAEVRNWLKMPGESISGLLFQPFVQRPDVIQAATIRVRPRRGDQVGKTVPDEQISA